MKTIFKKFLSFVLIICLFLGSLSSSFGNYEKNISKTEIEELQKDYYIRSELETPYGKAYFVADKKTSSQYEDRLFWDLVDIAMAGRSWAKMFNDPSWENFGTAVIDTAGLLPLVPSLSTVRNSDEAIKAIANAYKKDKRVRDKVNATKKVIRVKTIRFPTIVINRSQLERKFGHMSEIGLTTKTSLIGIKEPLRTQLLQKYQDEIVKILKNSKEIFEGKTGNTESYIFTYGGKLVHLRRDNFEFLSAYKLDDKKYKNLKNDAVRIEKSGNLVIKKF